VKIINNPTQTLQFFLECFGSGVERNPALVLLCVFCTARLSLRFLHREDFSFPCPPSTLQHAPAGSLRTPAHSCWAGRPARPHKPAEEINEAAESDVYKSCASFLDVVAAENRSCRRPVTDHGGGSCGTAFDLGGIFAEESDLDEKENE